MKHQVLDFRGDMCPDSATFLHSRTGFAHTDSGKLVYGTGRVLIGLRAGETTGAAPHRLSDQVSQQVSDDAERLQAALLLLRRAHRKPTPKPTLLARVGALFRSQR
jgi:hypothetical protein